METIVIATDFSDASRNALLCGLQIAEALNARIVLLNVCSVVVPFSEVTLMVNETELTENNRTQLNNQIAGLQYHGPVLIEKRVEKGIAEHEIIRVAAQENATWIVAGIKGHNKLNRLIFGGTAVSLARQSPVAVLLVPGKGDFNVPAKIILAADLNPETQPEIFEPVILACKSFNAALQLVSVRTDSSQNLHYQQAVQAKVQEYFKDVKAEFNFLDNSDSVSGITGFIIKVQTDVIAVVPGGHSLFEQIFSKSTTMEMIIQSNVPLMILPGKKAAVAKDKCKREETCKKCPACRKKSFLAEGGGIKEHAHEHDHDHEHAH